MRTSRKSSGALFQHQPRWDLSKNTQTSQKQQNIKTNHAICLVRCYFDLLDSYWIWDVFVDVGLDSCGVFTAKPTYNLYFEWLQVVCVLSCYRALANDRLLNTHRLPIDCLLSWSWQETTISYVVSFATLRLLVSVASTFICVVPSGVFLLIPICLRLGLLCLYPLGYDFSKGQMWGAGMRPLLKLGICECLSDYFRF